MKLPLLSQVNAESLDVSPATKEEIPTAQQYLAHLSTKQLTASASEWFSLGISTLFPSTKEDLFPVLLQPVPKETGYTARPWSIMIKTERPTTIDHCHYVWCHFLGWIANWLVVDLPLWKIWKSNGIIIPSIWKNIKCSKAPTSYGDGLRKNSPFQMPVDPHGPSGGDYDWSESRHDRALGQTLVNVDPYHQLVEMGRKFRWWTLKWPRWITLGCHFFFAFTFLFPVACGFNLTDIRVNRGFHHPL